MNKGFSDIHWTIAVWVAALIVIIAMLFFFIYFEVKGKEPMSYSIRFVEVSNKPYLVSGALLHLQIEDRQFIEHAIQSSVVGALSRSQSDAVPYILGGFMNTYRFEYHDILITGDRGDVYRLAKLNSELSKSTCGVDEKEKGFCFSTNYALHGKEICGVGRVPIAADASDCDGRLTPSGNLIKNMYVCCNMEVDIEAYEAGGKYNVVTCGDYDEGVCNDADCGASMVPLESGEYDCESANNGDTPHCCVLKTSDYMAYGGFATVAEIPLFYKSNEGVLSVVVGEDQ